MSDILEEQLKEEHTYLRQASTTHLTWFVFSCTINGTVLSNILTAEELPASFIVVPWLLVFSNLAGFMYSLAAVRAYRAGRNRIRTFVESENKDHSELGIPPRYWGIGGYGLSAVKLTLGIGWFVGICIGVPQSTGADEVIRFRTSTQEVEAEEIDDVPDDIARDHGEVVFQNAVFLEDKKKSPTGVTLEHSHSIDPKQLEALKGIASAAPYSGVILACAFFLFAAVIFSVTAFCITKGEWKVAEDSKDRPTTLVLYAVGSLIVYIAVTCHFGLCLLKAISQGS